MDGTQAAAKVKTSIEDRVGVITLSDPGTLNAAGLDLMGDLLAAFEDFAYGDKVRSIIITGEGRGFCSGANLSGGRAGSAPNPNGPNDSLLRTYNPFVSAVRKSPKPLISAVNGVAAGVGVSLALMGDLIVASESAYFLLAFRRIGLVPDGGATWLLPRYLGKARAMELMLLGEKLPAKTAPRLGPDQQVRSGRRTHGRGHGLCPRAGRRSRLARPDSQPRVGGPGRRLAPAAGGRGLCAGGRPAEPRTRAKASWPSSRSVPPSSRGSS
ncbi:enoyl-CoA hydratase-related protein [Phenylobacterium sp. J367]|uniref:enoyl-CoA hydratase-related protein n=1 Tax=Phenylobacterium sp. J367 TaxID=2898435 RepID=UPI0021517E9F|nr:enoyl-CoA hydratase-related protein [Phenylobacterium sp. J367]MCR5880562.1 enoyl-CoA hydratase-related protein [Phenylobacterium sp. J367]